MAAITGKIINALTGKPVSGALITFTDENGNPVGDKPMQTTSDPSGDFFFQTLGGYYFTIEHPAFVKQKKAVDISAFGTGGAYSQNFNIKLIPGGNVINTLKLYKTPILAGAGIIAAGLLISYAMNNGKKKKLSRKSLK